MITTKDVHKQFANYFSDQKIRPYLYLLSHSFSEGHVCIDLNNLNTHILIEAGYDEQLNRQDLESSDWVGQQTDYKPLIVLGDKLYFHRYFTYETKILKSIQSLILSGKQQRKENEKLLLKHKEKIMELFRSTDTSVLIDWQKIAAISAVLNSFNIITGGPGTGKTTTVAKLLSILFTIDPDMKVALAAPTGKAAARMAESLKNAGQEFEDLKPKFDNLEPSTIHRLLGVERNSIYFKHKKNNPLPHDLVIIDESSMIDIALFSKLLDAIKPQSKIIFLGDKDQLASVEAGSLFGDLCMAQGKLNQFSPASVALFNQFINEDQKKLTDEYICESHHLLSEQIIELRHSYRFSSESGIGQLSQAILHNQKEQLMAFSNSTDKSVRLDFEYSEEIFESFVAGFRSYIEEKDIAQALKKLNDLKVLCAVREGEWGLYALNDKIQKILQNQGLISVNTQFYEHRPVIVNSNNYELGLFNGDVGIVRKDENGQLKVWFEMSDGNLKSFLPAMIDAVDTVFAMTIHKSQGSEFKKVLVVLPNQQNMALLTRELLYTAVTRAKEEITLQATENVMKDCIGKSVERGSGIVERLINSNEN